MGEERNSCTSFSGDKDLSMLAGFLWFFNDPKDPIMIRYANYLEFTSTTFLVWTI